MVSHRLLHNRIIPGRAKSNICDFWLVVVGKIDNINDLINLALLESWKFYGKSIFDSKIIWNIN